ncbi:MAG: 50S ribosomal L9 C-terminal domain-containing protein [Dehalococcoidia bacterium]
MANFKALTNELDGMQISIESRAGANGKLFGSVTDTIIAQKLSELTEKDIHRRMIQTKDAIRETGIYDIILNLYPELTATIKLLVHATGTEPIWEEDTEPQDTEPQDTEAQDTEAQDTEAQDTEPQDTEAQDTEPQDTEKAS